MNELMTCYSLLLQRSEMASHMGFLWSRVGALGPILSAGHAQCPASFDQMCTRLIDFQNSILIQFLVSAQPVGWRQLAS